MGVWDRLESESTQGTGLGIKTSTIRTQHHLTKD